MNNNFNFEEQLTRLTQNMQNIYQKTTELTCNLIDSNVSTYKNITETKNFTDGMIDPMGYFKKYQKTFNSVFNERMNQYRDFYKAMVEIQTKSIEDCINKTPKGL